MKNLMLTQMINIATDDEEDEEGPPLIILVKDGRNFRRAEVEDDPDEGEEEQSMGNSHGLSIRTNLDETLTAEAPTTPSSVVHAAVELLSDAVTRGTTSPPAAVRRRRCPPLLQASPMIVAAAGEDRRSVNVVIMAATVLGPFDQRERAPEKENLPTLQISRNRHSHRAACATLDRHTMKPCVCNP